MSKIISVHNLFLCMMLLLAGCGGGTIGSSGGDTGSNRSIQGYARKSTQAPIADAAIVMSNDAGQARVSTTNADGTFEMLAPEGSDYSIEFQPDQTRPQTISLRYKAQLENDSVIKLTIQEQQQALYQATFVESRISLTNCPSYSVEDRQIIRTDDAASQGCRATIQYATQRSELKQFGLYATCQGKELLVRQSTVRSGKADLSLAEVEGCSLSKIEEISSNDPAKISFLIIDR
jgi:hypothetical protein